MKYEIRPCMLVVNDPPSVIVTINVIEAYPAEWSSENFLKDLSEKIFKDMKCHFSRVYVNGKHFFTAKFRFVFNGEEKVVMREKCLTRNWD